ncbi:MAG: fatty acid--CoA ligase [Blastocatellia bacterium]
MTPDIRTVADITRAHAAARPQETATTYNGQTTSYGELDRRASQAANGFMAEGLAAQTRVALLDKNTDHFFEILYGCAKSGMALVAVNWRLAGPEIAYVINDAMAEILFVGPEYFALVEGLRAELKTVRKIMALGETGSSEWEEYTAWRDRNGDTDPHRAVADDDVVMQMYTSGTTGHPKGAQLTSHNLITLLDAASVEWGGWSAADVSLVCMPLFHIGGAGWGLIGYYTGARNVVMREPVPAEILRLIAEQRVTKSFFVPALILFMLQSPAIATTDLSSLELIVYGASPIPLDLLRAAMKTLPCRFAQVYGLTETTGAFTYLRPEDHDLNNEKRLRSCGRGLSIAEIRIVDDAGNALPAGEVGEIIVRSPQNMKGYWNLPNETARAIRGAWFYTGDAGYLDEDGYLYIHDRVKDMIISGGENIYPAEVESALFGHPAIGDVAVIGVPDDKWGEAVKAIVVKKPGAEVTAEELIAYARERIAHYKTPKSVDFIAALPRNPSGKILKRELREPYWKDRERKVN